MRQNVLFFLVKNGIWNGGIWGLYHASCGKIDQLTTAGPWWGWLLLFFR